MHSGIRGTASEKGPVFWGWWRGRCIFPALAANLCLAGRGEPTVIARYWPLATAGLTVPRASQLFVDQAKPGTLGLGALPVRFSPNTAGAAAEPSRDAPMGCKITVFGNARSRE